MSRKVTRAVISIAVLGAALGLLFYATATGDAAYYKHVDEVTANPQQWYGKQLQLHGFVVDRSIEVRPETLDYRFAIQNNGQVVKAAYRGVVPDTFKDGAEVVVKGRLGPDGFAADEILAKCPSKYVPSK
jgi:cytochrome c-type biogenesis protein CcmE